MSTPVASGEERVTIRGLRHLAGRMPVRGRLGVLLVAIAWPLDWILPGLRTQLFFFPLWLGYILTVDGLVFARTGTSLWERGRARFAGLFVVSAPVWWLFELFNLRTDNWHYLGRNEFSDFQFAAGATIAFTTVIPAVFGTAELISSFLTGNCGGVAVSNLKLTHVVMFVLGWAMLACVLAWPRYCFPFVWTSLVCLVEPVNAAAGYRTILGVTRNRGWKPVVALGLAGPACGVFWEMWNYYSYPKWTYSVPFVGFLHIFEMPLLGYLGYIPFALELFVLYNLATGVARRGRGDYVRMA